ncbi:L-gulono-1,4-lactone dehydrogenase-like isoform X2 [Mytilus californianus]|uniref:L-gulono-1,4-lactone dehydrogenase-like isoform X2 n=1 Tax=Mytilus californianus TaxID=6549 RepID=UPI0022459687|nr:L-gulono-1,4-lactone dehydrogenase-like isoform X2 [Mytilus californianus]
MDVNQLLQRLRNDHGDIIDNVEELIKELHEHHVANNNDLFSGMLQEIGQLEAAVALDAFGHLLGGGGEAPVQPEPLQIPEPPAERMRPTSLVELIQNITDAAQRGNTIKAVGTKHSVEWTDIGHIDGTQIDMSDLNDVIHINRTVLNAVNQEMLDNRMICCFEAGATIEHVQEYLWPLGFRKTRFPDRYRVLPNQTGCTNLSLSGTIATGAHGNGLTKPIIADMVLSFLLLTVNENGEV